MSTTYTGRCWVAKFYGTKGVCLKRVVLKIQIHVLIAHCAWRESWLQDGHSVRTV